jgi:hypothetical protein
LIVNTFFTAFSHLFQRIQGHRICWQPGSTQLTQNRTFKLESDVTFLGEQALVKTFLKYITPLPSSAAVERLFSTGKDVLRAKRASLSDGAFPPV